MTVPQVLSRNNRSRINQLVAGYDDSWHEGKQLKMNNRHSGLSPYSRTILMYLMAVALTPGQALAANKVELIINQGHDSPVSEIVWTPDGKIVAACSNAPAPTIKLWDVATGCELRSWQCKDTVRSLSVSPDGWLLGGVLSGKIANEIKVWGVSTGREVRSIPVDSEMNSIAFSPDNKYIATGGGGSRPVRLWSIETSAECAQSFLDKNDAAPPAITTVVFSPDGKLLAAGNDRTAKIWNVADGSLVQSLSLPQMDALKNISFTADSKNFVTTLTDQFILFEVATGKEIGRYKHEAIDGNASYSCDGLAAGGLVDGRVVFWKPPGGTKMLTLSGYRDVVRTESGSRKEFGIARSIAYDEIRKTVAAAVANRILIRNLTGTGPAKIIDTDQHICGTVFTQDGQHLITAGLDGSIEVRDVEHDYASKKFVAHDDFIYTLDSSPDCKLFASSSFDGSTKIWDKSTHELKVTIPDACVSIRFSLDSSMICGIKRNGDIGLWKTTSGELVASLKPEALAVKSMAFSPDSKTLMFGGALIKTRPVKESTTTKSTTPKEDYESDEGQIQVWQIAEPAKPRVVRTRRGVTTGLAYTADGSSVYCLGADASLLLVDTATWLDHPVDTPLIERAIAQSEKASLLKGGELVTWSTTGINLYDINSGCKQLGDLACNLFAPAKEDQMMADARVICKFSPDGRLLATARGGGIKLWDIVKSAEVGNLSRHSDPVEGLTLSANAKVLASLQENGNARLWSLCTGKPLDLPVDKSAKTDLIGLSSDGSVAALVCKNNLILINVPALHVLKTFALGNDPLKSVSVASDGRTIYAASATDLFIYDSANTKMLQTRPLNVVSELQEFNKQATKLAVADRLGRVMIFDIAGSSPVTCPLHFSGLTKLRFSVDSRHLIAIVKNQTDRGASSSAPFSVKLIDAVNGAEVKTIQFDEEPSAVALSPKGILIVGLKSGELQWRSVDDIDKISKTLAHSRPITSIECGEDGRFIVTASADSAIKFWAQDEKELATLIPIQGGEWIAVADSGAFDSSVVGAALTHLKVAKEVVQLAQLKHTYFDPGLLAKILGFSNESRLVPTVNAADVQPYPLVSCDAPSKDDGLLIVKLKDRGGGIGRVEVKLNGKLLNQEMVPRTADKPGTEELVIVDLSRLPVRLNQENKISIRAFEKRNVVSSPDCEASWVPAGADANVHPELYAIVVGIPTPEADSQIRDQSTAVKDAHDIGQAIMTAGKRLFGAEHVHVTCPNIEGMTPEQARKTIQDQFFEARSSKPEDALFVYIAGPASIDRDQPDAVCFPTGKVEQARLQESSVRRAIALSFDDLADWTKNMPAIKQAVVFDIKPIDKLNADQKATCIKAVNNLSDQTGAQVLLRLPEQSDADQTRYGQGLLAHALIKSLKNWAVDRDIAIRPLLDRTEAQLRQMTLSTNASLSEGESFRSVFPTDVADFVIGNLSAPDQGLLPLGRCPVVLNQVSFDRGKIDPIDLGKTIRNRIAELKSTQAPQVQNISCDTNVAAPQSERNSIKANCDYTLSGDKVGVAISLKRGDQNIGVSEVTGNKLQLDRLSDEIIAAINRVVEKIDEEAADN